MLALLGLVATCLLLIIGLAALLFPHELDDQRFALPAPAFPAPRLQTSPPADMRAFYAGEMAQLNGVGWQDRAHGIVHMPIEQAMQKVAREGIAGWPK